MILKINKTALWLVLFLAVSICRADTYKDVQKQLEDGRSAGANLVRRIAVWNPGQDVMAKLRDKYNLARQEYASWANQTSRAVRGLQDIDPRTSEAANDARASLADLSSFCEETKQELLKKSYVQSSWTADQKKQNSSAVETAIKVASDHANHIAAITKWIVKELKGHRDRLREHQKELADAIEESGKWLTFDDIISGVTQ